MSEDTITVRLRRDHATFLNQNLTRMAEHTRDAMKSPSLPKERRNALYSRAILLEYIDDAIRDALTEVARAMLGNSASVLVEGRESDDI